MVEMMDMVKTACSSIGPRVSLLGAMGPVQAGADMVSENCEDD